MDGEYKKWLFYTIWDLIDKYGINKVRDAVKKLGEKYDIHS